MHCNALHFGNKRTVLFLYTQGLPYQAILVDVRRLIKLKFNSDEKQLIQFFILIPS